MCVCVQSEKLLLFDTVQSELEEKIRRLEEDRHSIDITSGDARRAQSSNQIHFESRRKRLNSPVSLFSELWNDELSGRKKRRDALSPDKKRRRPSVVSDILPLLMSSVTADSTWCLCCVYEFQMLVSGCVLGSALNSAHAHISSTCCPTWTSWRTGRPSER